jgi:hypothetical protein
LSSCHHHTLKLLCDPPPPPHTHTHTDDNNACSRSGVRASSTAARRQGGYVQAHKQPPAPRILILSCQDGCRYSSAGNDVLSPPMSHNIFLLSFCLPSLFWPFVVFHSFSPRRIVHILLQVTMSYLRPYPMNVQQHHPCALTLDVVMVVRFSSQSFETSVLPKLTIFSLLFPSFAVLAFHSFPLLRTDSSSMKPQCLTWSSVHSFGGAFKVDNFCFVFILPEAHFV